MWKAIPFIAYMVVGSAGIFLGGHDHSWWLGLLIWILVAFVYFTLIEVYADAKARR